MRSRLNNNDAVYRSRGSIPTTFAGADQAAAKADRTSSGVKLAG